MMDWERKKKTRKSIRLPDFDYSSTARYFVTICTFQKQAFLGKIEFDHITLSEIGKRVADCWDNLGYTKAGVTPEQFVVMPNHIHGIILINNKKTDEISATSDLPTVIRSFKGFTAYEGYSNCIVRRLWQRGYYEHVIRDEKELQKIQDYIQNNPANWLRDKYYSA